MPAIAFSLEGLNEQQRRAVELTDGRILILAGAGSGKTRVLTMRMAHLIENCGVQPEAILGVTFTNKAAAEMRGRMTQLISPEKARRVTLSTFHSFCMRLLRREIHRLGYTRQFSIYDPQDVQRLIRAIVRDSLQHEGTLPSLGSLTAEISRAKNSGLAPSGGSGWYSQFLADLYDRLQVAMRAYNAVDFDDLLLLAVKLLEEHPEVLQELQDRYRYIMIDEYQDTNCVQDKLASLLAEGSGNLCVVGDDDQSIYGWRGAEVRNILSFPFDERITLEQNYRSSNTILRAANAVIGHNEERHDKELWSCSGEGEKIHLLHAGDERREAEWVVFQLAHLRQQLNLPWSSFAIMYRSNALSRRFEMALMNHTWVDGDEWRRGIPYEVYGGTEFYARKEIKDLFAYLRLICNRRDEEALLRVVNHPRRGIGDKSLDLLTSYNREQHIPLWQLLEGVSNGDPSYENVRKQLSGRGVKGLEDFVSVVTAAERRFANEALSEALLWLLERIGYRKAIEEEVKSKQVRDFKWENVQELVNALAEFEREGTAEGEAVELADFVASSPLGEGENDRATKSRDSNAVNLLTFHSAKGLEWPVCFLVGLEDHLIPHQRSVQEGNIQEERRLMYVAMTRAEQRLFLTAARVRARMGVPSASQPSRFLLEIPKECLTVSRC